MPQIASFWVHVGYIACISTLGISIVSDFNGLRLAGESQSADERGGGPQDQTHGTSIRPVSMAGSPIPGEPARQDEPQARTPKSFISRERYTALDPDPDEIVQLPVESLRLFSKVRLLAPDSLTIMPDAIDRLQLTESEAKRVQGAIDAAFGVLIRLESEAAERREGKDEQYYHIPALGERGAEVERELISALPGDIAPILAETLQAEFGHFGKYPRDVGLIIEEGSRGDIRYSLRERIYRSVDDGHETSVSSSSGLTLRYPRLFDFVE